MTHSLPSKPLEWTNLAFGALLFCAPFLPSFGAAPGAIWSAYVIGALVMICSAIALVRFGLWAEWTNLTAGLWLVIAPFVLGFAAHSTPMWVHLLLGCSIAAIAGLQLHRGYGEGGFKTTR